MAECWCPETRPSWANTWGVGRSISQLLLGPHAPNTLRSVLRHIGAFLDHLVDVDTPAGRVPVPKTGWNEQIYQLLWGSNAPNTFWRFLRHIGTFLDYLTGVDTPVGRVCVPRNKAKLSKYMGSGEVNISASIKASCTTFIWEFLRHIGTFVYHLGCVNTPMGRASPPKTRPNWANTLGSREVNISASIKDPCTKYFL